jgi:hypothetical protein
VAAAHRTPANSGKAMSKTMHAMHEAVAEAMVEMIEMLHHDDRRG